MKDWLARLFRVVCLVLLPLASAPTVAGGPARLSVCNQSTTTPMYLAQASRYNWGYSYETVGWVEVPVSLGMGSLGMRCVFLGGLSSDPVQFAIAHIDAKGEMALYAYEFELGSSIKAGESWFCVRLEGPFRFRARGFEELANCEPGALRIRFSHYLEFNEDDEMTISFVPDPNDEQHKVATFAELAKGRFGAVAIHPKTLVYGFSHELLGPREAADAAMSSCEASGCELVGVAQAKCLAIAFGPSGGYKVTSAGSQEAAVAGAAAECKKSFGECAKPLPAGCSTRD